MKTIYFPSYGSSAEKTAYYEEVNRIKQGSFVSHTYSGDYSITEYECDGKHVQVVENDELGVSSYIRYL